MAYCRINLFDSSTFGYFILYLLTLFFRITIIQKIIPKLSNSLSFLLNVVLDVFGLVIDRNSCCNYVMRYYSNFFRPKVTPYIEYRWYNFIIYTFQLKIESIEKVPDNLTIILSSSYVFAITDKLKCLS